MNLDRLLSGYTRRPDGTYARQVTFVSKRLDRSDGIARETLVRDARGRLLRVERTQRALALRRTRA